MHRAARFRLGSGGRWLSTCATLPAWLGCAPDTCLGLGWRRFVHQDDRPVWFDIANDLQANRLGGEYMMRFVTPHGESLLSVVRFFQECSDPCAVVGHVTPLYWAAALEEEAS